MTKAELIESLKDYPDDTDVMVGTGDLDKIDPAGCFTITGIETVQFCKHNDLEYLCKDVAILSIDE
jgi:hypothetical protein